MEMLNSQERAVLSSSPVLFEAAGLAYLDLCILYIHFFESQEHKRNTCCININTNILLLEPAQAAKEHSASAGSILTHHFVNSESRLQNQSQRLRCAVHCSLADPLQKWPCSSSAPAHPQGGGHTSNSCVWPGLSPGQQLGSITTVSPASLQLRPMIGPPRSAGGLSKSRRRWEGLPHF